MVAERIWRWLVGSTTVSPGSWGWGLREVGRKKNMDVTSPTPDQLMAILLQGRQINRIQARLLAIGDGAPATGSGTTNTCGNIGPDENESCPAYGRKVRRPGMTNAERNL